MWVEVPSAALASARSMAVKRTTAKRASTAGARSQGRRWSQHVTETSDALDLEPGVFQKRSGRQIAVSLKRSADRSRRRKADAFQSAMSMLTFYANRAGKHLSPERKHVLDLAKSQLRVLYGRAPGAKRS